MKHCADYLDDPKTPEALRAFLSFELQPATAKIGAPLPPLFARYYGKPVRVTMASRLGDLGISYSMTSTKGYSKRVPVSDLRDFRTIPHGAAA